MEKVKQRLSEKEIREYEQEHVFHPWRAQKDFNPPVIDRAKGNYFYTIDGKVYLDFSSQYVVTSLGHADNRVVGAIADQAKRLPYINHQTFTEPKARLGKLLSEITPGDISKTFFSNGGAASVIMLAPPFTITKDEIDRAMEVLDRALAVGDREYAG